MKKQKFIDFLARNFTKMKKQKFIEKEKRGNFVCHSAVDRVCRNVRSQDVCKCDGLWNETRSLRGPNYYRNITVSFLLCRMSTATPNRIQKSAPRFLEQDEVDDNKVLIKVCAPGPPYQLNFSRFLAYFYRIFGQNRQKLYLC